MKKQLVFVICAITLLFGCSNNKQTLNIFTWSDYFDPELIAKFEEDNNCKVLISTFDSNEAMYAKLKAGGSGYDIMVPTSYQVQLLADENMIIPINVDKLQNVKKNFNHALDGQILDKDMKWSVPYACTYTGLMCNKSIAEEAKSWKILSNSKYKGKISLLDDIREVIGIGLMYNGYSINSTNEQEIVIATKTIVEWKKNIRKFDAESYKLEVADGSSLIGHGYSADAAQVIISDGRDDLCFILPNEGFTVAWDEFVISSGTQNEELAYKFIDFFYDDNNSLQNMIYICSLMANKNSFDKLPNEYKDLFMPANLNKGQLLKGFKDPNILEMYNKSWDTIKSIK